MADTKEAIQSLLALSRKAEIIITLQAFTSRNLTVSPPGDAETLGVNLGLGERNLDRFVRPWINKRFRVPDGKDRLPPGSITGKTTFKQLLDLAGA